MVVVRRMAVAAGITAGQAARIDLMRVVSGLLSSHEQEEGRPIETLWDVTTAATAFARSRPNTDKRLEIERTAGELLKLAV